MRVNSRHKKKTGATSLYGFLWADPIGEDGFLRVVQVGEELEISATKRFLESPDHPCDLIRQYELARKTKGGSKDVAGSQPPHIRFANATTDDLLIGFVRNFGPVTARSYKTGFSGDSSQPQDSGTPPVLLITARQELSELRSEQRIYQSAMRLVFELRKKEIEYNFEDAQQQIAQIAKHVSMWQKQWERERVARRRDPLWKISEESIRRITAFADSRPDPILTFELDARIVLCELINTFPGLAFPNVVELRSYIQFGIRPLLYSLLRREFFHPHDVGICSNTQCRNFFETKRVGQNFCNEDCSRKHRQRNYWHKQGKDLRKEKAAKKSRTQRID